MPKRKPKNGIPAIAKTHRKLIQARLRQGYLLKTIAADLGVKPPSISEVLAKTYHYHRSRRVGAIRRLVEPNLTPERVEPLKWAVFRYQSDFGPIPEHIMAQIAKPITQRSIPKPKRTKRE